MKEQLSKNIYQDELIERYPIDSTDSQYEKLQAAHEAFESWREAGMEKRRGHIQNLASLLEEKEQEAASLISMEMGKPISQAVAEIRKCADLCRYYAGHAAGFLKEEVIHTEAEQSFISYQPLGVILGIMPWNFPFWQVFRYAVPAVVAGNVSLLKHASNVPGCASMIESLFLKAGCPKGVMTSVYASSGDANDLLSDDRLAAVTLTGSEKAGSAVAAAAGKHIKKSILELGGSDPFIVCPDADLPLAARMAVKSRMINNGQSCIAAKRFIVVGPIMDEFVKLVQQELDSLRIGDPLEEDTELGPLARKDLLNLLDDQVGRSLDEGAVTWREGGPDQDHPLMYKPVILGHVAPGMTAFEEELFGPVMPFIPAKDLTDAIHLANASSFGLGASIWSQDKKAAAEAARRVESGSVFVNHIVQSDKRLPFGGVKRSGYGRELSHYAVKAFMNVQTIWID